MQKRSLPIIMSTLMIVILSLTGCGNDQNAETNDQNKTLSDTVRIVTQADAGQEAVASLPDGFSVEAYQKIEELEGQILNGSYDLAVVTAVDAAKLYSRTGGDLVAVSPVTLNDWSILSNNGGISSQQISDLRGKTIVACGQGGTGDTILRKLLTDNGINPDYRVRMEWVDTPAQVLEALKEEDAVALLQEPYVSQALGMSSGSDGLSVDIDLGALWTSAYGSPIPAQVLIANKRFVQERGDDFHLFVAAMGDSLGAAKKSSTADLVFYGKSNRGVGILESFMALVAEYDIDLLGGKSPDAAFYYGIGE